VSGARLEKRGEVCTGVRAVRCVGSGKRRRAAAGVRELEAATYVDSMAKRKETDHNNLMRVVLSREERGSS